jgi:serine/threonine protein kinase
MSDGFAQPADAFASRYVVERELGRGGMATVYFANDLKLGRPVALKVLRPELAASLGNERFLREIEIAARLSHPHILPLHDSGEAGGSLYYAMPYVEGESLRQKLEREGQLPVNEVIAIVHAVAGALAHAHQHGIVHRDIKPENILLAKNSDGAIHPVVADFGIARALDKAGGERLTETGLALGTPAYMSPEQAGSDPGLDGRSDIYSLGCVAYEMLAGLPPFTGTTSQAILARHAVDPVPPLHTVRSTVPQSVEAAIERALAKVPGDRFSTADEFAQALESESSVTVPRRRISIFRSRRIMAAIAVLVVAAGLGVRLVSYSARATVLPSASRIAVLPLLSLSGDTALARLGKDLANTISASLAGVGGIQPVDRLTIGAITAGKNLSPADGASLARRLGASSIVHGTLVGAGDRVRLDLGLYSTEKLEPLATGVTISSHRDSIRLLTDSAAMGVLRQVWQRGEPPSPSLAAVTTRSIPALRAFLDGERAIQENRWDDAELAYAAATKADSTFWLAHWRRSYAKWWYRETLPDSGTASMVLDHLAELPEKERLLAENWARSQREPYTKEFLKRFRAVTERFPDYWPGWLAYGDALFHFGPLLGHDLREAREAFERVLQLNPRVQPAWGHLDGVARMSEDTALLTRTTARRNQHDGLSLDLVDRIWEHIIRGGEFEGALADTVVDHVASLGSPGDFSALWFSGFRPGAQVEMSRQILARRPAMALAALHRKGIAMTWAARGGWDSALAGMDEYAGRASELAGLSEEEVIQTGAAPELATLDAYRIAVIGAWLGALDPEHSFSRREAAAQATDRFSDRFKSPRRQVELLWLDGLLAASQRDLAGLRQARGQLLKGDTSWTRPSIRSLAAFELELLGRRREAADSMAALAWEWWNWGVGPYFLGVTRLAAARWLAAERDLDQAADMLLWHRVAFGNQVFGHGQIVLGGVSYLEMARVEAARGNESLAREYYQRFLQRYDMPSPRMQHLVDEARAALTRLES